jgi:hypothetical protein
MDNLKMETSGDLMKDDHEYSYPSILTELIRLRELEKTEIEAKNTIEYKRESDTELKMLEVDIETLETRRQLFYAIASKEENEVLIRNLNSRLIQMEARLDDIQIEGKDNRGLNLIGCRREDKSESYCPDEVCKEEYDYTSGMMGFGIGEGLEESSPVITETA